MRARQAKKNRRRAARLRYRALLAYIASQRPEGWQAASRRGLIWKLEQLAFLADLEAFRWLGRSLTGGRWAKTAHGVRWREPE